MAAHRLAHTIAELTIYDRRHSDPATRPQRIKKTDLGLT
jgi:hypothetical protein